MYIPHKKMFFVLFSYCFLPHKCRFSKFDVLVSRLLNLGPVVRRPISANLRLNFGSGFFFF